MNKDEGNSEIENVSYWISYNDIINYFPRFYRIVMNKWYIFTQLIFTVVIIIFELIFRFTNELYSSRPINIYTSIFTPIIESFGLIIFILIIRNFSKQVIQRRNTIISELNIEAITETKKIELSRLKKINLIINRFFMYSIPWIILIIVFSFFIKDLVNMGPGYYNPNIPIGYFMAILREVLSLSILFTVSLCGLYIGSSIGVLKQFPQKINLKNLVLKPTQKDTSGGFKPIGELVIWTTFLIILLNIINLTLRGIGNLVNRILIEPLSIAEENILDNQNLGGNFIWIFVIILLSILIGTFAYAALTNYNVLLKKYKEDKLKPLIEKRNEIISKIALKPKTKIINKDWNEIQKYDYFIKEFNSIDNWPVRLTFIITIFGSGFLPAIITLIFKLIEIFVLK